MYLSNANNKSIVSCGSENADLSNGSLNTSKYSFLVNSNMNGNINTSRPMNVIKQKSTENVALVKLTLVDRYIRNISVIVSIAV